MAPIATTSNGTTPSATSASKDGSAVASSSSSSQKTMFDASSYLSVAAKARLPSPIRSLFPFESIPGMLSLLAGKPNADTYPIASISVQLKPEHEGEAATKLDIAGADLEEALQYGPSAGLPRLNKWLVDLQSSVHRRPKDAEQWKVTVGVGSQDLLNKAFEMVLDPEHDSILVEAPAYAGVLPCIASLRVNVVSIDSDEEGPSPAHLARIMAEWPQDKRKPKCLYTTPTGANPSGTTQSEQRKRDILAICRQYGVLVLEDDPYYYLSFEGLGEDPVTRNRPLSYFALDGEGEGPSGLVLRFDSFSKVLSGGLRLGYMAAHPTFTAMMDRATASANLQCSGVAQVVALSILEHFELPGFLAHVDRVSTFYRDRRDRFEGTARRILGGSSGQKAVAEWVTPTAGMFLWLKLLLPAGVEDSFDIVSQEARQAGVLAVPGRAFMPRGEPSVYVRTSFSLLPEEHFDEVFQRIRRVVEGVWAKHS